MMNVLSGAIAGGGPLAVIASMITPAFLILSAANLITSSLVRLGRSVDRARVVIDRMETLGKAGDASGAAVAAAQLRRYGRRGQIVQTALGTFYLAIGLSSRRVWLSP
ncbi:MAG TPA: DUF2721 domain-containing protein [Candidatus Baltobacteraceae bacterium]|nr:DUF2721 domain-containing protein [Candidatus Baltobacteraceae bacterium]